MSSITKATFVLVPGSLHTKGYPAEVISHPSIGLLASTAPPDADAANLRQVLEKLIKDQEKDIILFCHSYGGIPGSQSINGLERSARAKAGKKGGILKVIYLTAILPREGESLLQTLTEARIPRADWAEIDPATGTFSANSRAAAALFHDLPDDQAEHWASRLEPMSAHFVATDVGKGAG
ncbi:hypothetical protein B0H19DRAFT_1225443 [Mycena capillaripes]|nr:hypothetical protein B0H19DRAFT_1225443 [Mycena capillaripes]